MVRGLIGVRRARFSALGALMLVCAWIPLANARQSSQDGAATKPAATKTTAWKHPKTSAVSSSSAATTSTSKSHAGKRSSRRKSVRTRGQQKIDSERAQAIQEALIREHYMSGEASGTWNQASEDAMRRYQADHGWQSKTVPDSRALISLGLGPSKDHLLNPESAMTTVENSPRAAAPPTTSHTGPPAAGPTPATTPTQSDPLSPQ
jgi:hypothetical protein